jgi:hypothetical protein
MPSVVINGLMFGADDMLGDIVRLVNTLANLLVVLTTAVGVPQAAVRRAAGAYDFCSAQPVISLEVLSGNRLPAEAAASRNDARTKIATVWRSVPFQPGVLSAGIVLPAPALSGTLARVSGVLCALASFSSSLVRGPPLAI